MTQRTLDATTFPLGKRELVIMLGLAGAMQSLAMDAMLPALGQIAADLDLADPNRRQLVVGIYLIGMGVGSLLPGTLADRYGRKRILVGIMLAYAVLCGACALVTDFTVLIGLRLVCGLAAGGLAAVASAVVRDRFSGDEMASLQSLIAMIFMFVPMLAPSLGQLVLLVASWRWIFGLIALLAASMSVWIGVRLPETLSLDRRIPITLQRVFGSTREVLLCRRSIGYVLASSMTIGVMWGYIQSCQQLVAEHFGAGTAFPLIFGGMSLMMLVANLINSRLVLKVGARRAGHTALLVYAITALAQYAAAHSGQETLWQFVPLMTINITCAGFMSANFIAISMEPFARIAGAASSLQLFLRTLTAALIGMAIGQAYDDTAGPLSTAMVIASVSALGLILFSENGRLFRRYGPQVPTTRSVAPS